MILSDTPVIVINLGGLHWVVTLSMMILGFIALIFVLILWLIIRLIFGGRSSRSSYDNRGSNSDWRHSMNNPMNPNSPLNPNNPMNPNNPQRRWQRSMNNPMNPNSPLNPNNPMNPNSPMNPHRRHRH